MNSDSLDMSSFAFAWETSEYNVSASSRPLCHLACSLPACHSSLRVLPTYIPLSCRYPRADDVLSCICLISLCLLAGLEHSPPPHSPRLTLLCTITTTIRLYFLFQYLLQYPSILYPCLLHLGRAGVHSLVWPVFCSLVVFAPTALYSLAFVSFTFSSTQVFTP